MVFKKKETKEAVEVKRPHNGFRDGNVIHYQDNGDIMVTWKIVEDFIIDSFIDCHFWNKDSYANRMANWKEIIEHIEKREARNLQVEVKDVLKWLKTTNLDKAVELFILYLELPVSVEDLIIDKYRQICRADEQLTLKVNQISKKIRGF